MPKKKRLIVTITLGLILISVFAVTQKIYMGDKETEIEKEYQHYTEQFKKAVEEGDIDKEIAMLKKSLELKPHDYTSSGTLGEIYYNMKKFDEAEYYIKLAIRDTPVHVLTKVIRAADYYMLSVIMIKRDKDYQAAIEYMKKAVEIMPDYSNAMYMLGKLYMEVGDYEKGVETLKKATEVIPDYIDTYLELGGYYLYKEKDFKRAEEYYKKAKEIDPNDGSPNSSCSRDWRGVIELCKRRNGSNC